MNLSVRIALQKVLTDTALGFVHVTLHYRAAKSLSSHHLAFLLRAKVELKYFQLLRYSELYHHVAYHRRASQCEVCEEIEKNQTSNYSPASQGLAHAAALGT